MGFTCGICGNAGISKNIVATEMMLGSGDEFEYTECSKCGCIQINEIPDNLSEYYPKDRYYSLADNNVKKCNPVKAFIKRARAKYFFGENRNILGAVLCFFYRPRPIFWWLKDANVKLGSKILDVGCGSGGLLLKLREEGFRENTFVGIDPFLENDIQYKNDVTVLKGKIYDIDEKFDLVMFHDSFEHMADPLDVMGHLSYIVKAGGYVLIRMPIVSSYAWRKYNVNWVQFDAPRHLFLYTVKSVQILAEKSGFVLKNIKYDSSDFQFYGSELYQRGISIKDTSRDAKSFFSKKTLKGFQQMADHLNDLCEGDQAGFYLKKP